MQNKRDNYRSGRVDPVLIRKEPIENSPVVVLMFGGNMPCVFLCVNTVRLKVVTHYNFSVPSMSVMGSQKKFG